MGLLMADREKLWKLVKEAIHSWESDVNMSDHITDHLIANGVTVRKRGRWIPHYETFDADMAIGILGGNYQTGWQCSVCGRYEPGKEPYCNCGADMRGEEE